MRCLAFRKRLVTKGAEQENWNAEATGIDESVSGVIVADNGPEILILSYA